MGQLVFIMGHNTLQNSSCSTQKIQTTQNFGCKIRFLDIRFKN